MKKLKLLIISSFFYSAISLAQIAPTDNLMGTTEVIQGNQIKETTKEKYSDEDIRQLEEYLNTNNYIGFYEYFQKTNVKAEEQIKYLESKIYDFHVPLYWLIADYYAKKNSEFETHKWLYIATIMTQQDADLCVDTTSKNAARKLMKAFPAAPEISRKSPEHIIPSMQAVMFFIENIRERRDPSWACNFGEDVLTPGASILVEKAAWELRRKLTFDRFTKDFMK